MPFTKQHFEVTAKVLRNVKIQESDKETLYRAFASEFESLNPNFDSDRFHDVIFPTKQETVK